MAPHLPAAGCYGKLPALGDFVSRRLPRSFVQPWDAWLQRALAASRAQLGADWLETWLASPFWRFALAPGVCGPEAWMGVLMPSADRVGRPFPFTVALPRPAAPLACRRALHARSWFDAVERLMLAALHPDHEPARLDADLLALPPPEEPAAYDGRRAWHIPLPAGVRTLAGFGAALDGLAQAGCDPHSAWITTGSDDVPASLLVCAGLPPEDGFASLLDGHWSDPAWGGARCEPERTQP
jgi:type VI secretion system protein ImpM